MKAYRNWTFREKVGVDRWGGETTMREIGNRIAVKVVQRTMSGRDETGAAFAPYKTTPRFKYGKGAVDLYDSGRMLNDFNPVEVTSHRVRVGFNSARSREIAGYHMTGTWKMAQRRLIGMNREWLADIKARIFGKSQS